MPHVVSERIIALDRETAFKLSQTTGEFRLRWDPFIRSQRFLDGAQLAAKGVRTRTRSRLGLLMISEYVSYTPPQSVGMKMIQGPWFFVQFGGGWRFAEHDAGTRAVWKYTFSCRPGWLRWLTHPVGRWLLSREIERRISAFAATCEDPALIAELRAALS
ncbi:SRPBCC family protein [Psychromicrobium xiongbiense]|uniref:SRPBCC family protein n=1 Tax=Psychromicrobium xiongbiense TaxID=3051184 RepID=UPI0025523E7E|nr:SRPBCC family protein [Psychromicrobium sp. YIM S02556]